MITCHSQSAPAVRGGSRDSRDVAAARPRGDIAARVAGRAIRVLLATLVTAGTASFPAAAGRARAAEVAAEQAAPAALVVPDAATVAADRAAAWLAASQLPDGSWGSGGFRGSAAVTAQVVMALVAAGSTPSSGRHVDAVARGVDFLVACAGPDGLIAGNEDAAHGPMYGHIFATTALAEVYGETADDEKVARILAAARDLLARAQGDTGGWRYRPVRGEADLSVTAAGLVALRGLHNAGVAVDERTVDRATACIEDMQNPDGGFRYLADAGPSGSARTAAAVFALLVAGRDGAAVDRGFGWLDGNPIVPGGADGYALYGLAYEAAARWRRGGRPGIDRPGWTAWHAAAAASLLEVQRPDGSWQDPSCPEYGTAAAVTVLCMPRATVPLFEAEPADAGVP